MSVSFLSTYKLRLASIGVTGVVLAGVVSPSALAYADSAAATDSNVTASDVTAALADTPDVLATSDTTAVASDGDSAMVATAGGTEVDVPKDLSDGVTLGASNGSSPSVDIALPGADTAADAQKVATGVVAYPNGNGSANAVQAVEDGSVRMFTVIDSANAPTTYDYKITVPGGGHIEITSDGGAAIYDADGQFVAGSAAPWAKDANGASVNTYFTTDGQSLVQHVDHNAYGVAYPVTADPWFGIKLIDHVKWAGATLQVFPTTWARYWAGPEARGTAWNDIVKAAPSANKPAMRDQFYCHWDWVRLRAPNKPSWNLDLNRPDVGYWTMVRKQCNP